MREIMMRELTLEEEALVGGGTNRLPAELVGVMFGASSGLAAGLIAGAVWGSMVGGAVGSGVGALVGVGYVLAQRR
jgi:hypothetical protein